MTLSKYSFLALTALALFFMGFTSLDTNLPKANMGLIIPALAGTYFVYKDIHEKIQTPYAFAKIEEKAGDIVKIRLSKKSFRALNAAEQEALEARRKADTFWDEVFDLTEEQFKELNIQKVVEG